KPQRPCFVWPSVSEQLNLGREDWQPLEQGCRVAAHARVQVVAAEAPGIETEPHRATPRQREAALPARAEAGAERAPRGGPRAARAGRRGRRCGVRIGSRETRGRGPALA